MEPSQGLTSSEEFNGTESGWTTYIGSQIHSEIYNDDEKRVDLGEYGKKIKSAHQKFDVDKKGEKNYDWNRNTDNEESDDDSMTSDASSGPSRLQLECIKGRHGKILSEKRATKQVRKTKYEGLVEEEGSQVVADSAASHT